MECNDAEKKKFYLVSEISVSDCSQNFNKNRVEEKKHIIIQKNNSFLILKKDHKSFAIFKDQDKIHSEDETQIFVVYNTILLNFYDTCKNYKRIEKFYEKINNLNYALWKSIPKCPKNISINEENKDIYLYNLKENDIIRLGKIKLILREFHIANNNKKEKNNNERPFTMKLKKFEGKICSICDKSNTETDNPIIQFCLCEKYKHFKCQKEKIKELIFFDGNNDDYISYSYKTQCFDCKNFILSSFIIEDNKKECKLFELFDFPRKENDDYLLFETIDYKNNYQEEYFKMFFFIKLNKKEKDKNIQSILLGRKSNRYKYKRFDNYIFIKNTDCLSHEHAKIEYNIKEKTLVLRNISKTLNTLVLQKQISLEPNKNILLEVGNVQINSYLISNDDKKIEEINTQMKNDPSIEFRDNSQK